MTWASWTAVVLYLLIFCLGPLRGRFWENWRFTVPASIGGWLGWFVGHGVREQGEPWWLPAMLGVFVGVGAGAATKRWLDETLGRA